MKLPLERKVWGQVRHAFGSEACAVSVLHVQAGGYCSRHSHRERVNRFLLVSAILDVVHYTADGTTETSRARLFAGDVHDVPAGVIHRFEVVEPGVVVEVYWPAAPGSRVRADDIERLDTGGMA